MIRVNTSGDWEDFTKLTETWQERYEWFLFEFAKQFAIRLQKRMFSQINHIKGPKDYKRRLVVAEHKMSNSSWFALAVKARPVIGKDSDTSLLTITSRFSIENDPVKDILEFFGPWTIETIPFAPSQRQALVTIRNASKEIVSATRKRNIGQINEIKAAMDKKNMSFEDRSTVMKSLRVSESIEKQIIDLEFGIKNSKHWIPAIRWARINVVKRMMSDKRLVGAMIDPSNRKWMNRKHLRDKLRQADLRSFYKFQERVRKSLPPS